MYALLTDVVSVLFSPTLLFNEMFADIHKCLLFIPSDQNSFNLLPPEIPVVRDGFILLSSPIGSPSFCSTFATNKVRTIQSIPLLSDVQDF